mmetsp:Transcript_107695/g.131412  ORF Transcript_107695/g.131412 Transcript_107695/m.131412 type:complete len:389 (-) Transcript_107695:103-1269(-)
MLAVTLEGVAAMEHTVVVQQHNVTLLHGHDLDVLLAHLVDVSDIVVRDGGQVAAIDIRHTNLGHGARAPVPQVAAVVVQVAEPNWLTCHWVLVDGRLSMLNCLQAVWIGLVGTIDHLQVHVELGCHYFEDQILQEVGGRFSEAIWQGTQKVEIQVAHRDSHLVGVDPFQNIWVHVLQNLGSICNQKLTSTFRSLLEADKSSIGRSLHKGGFVVKAHKVPSQRRLVHGLVHCMFLLLHCPEPRSVDRIQAGVQLQGLIELPEAIWALGGLKVAEPNGTMILQLSHDLLLLSSDPFLFGALLQFISQFSSINDQRCCLLHLRNVLDINAIGIPNGCRAIWQGTREICGLALSHCSWRRLLPHHFGSTAGALLPGCNRCQGGSSRHSTHSA